MFSLKELQVKKAKLIEYILLAFLCLVVSVLCFGNLLGSCAGHPPITLVGVWIIPLSLLGGSIFLYLSMFFWKLRRLDKVSHLKKEAILLPKKVMTFMASFVAAIIAYFLLIIPIFLLVIPTEGWIENWLSYFLFLLLAFVAIYVGIVVYRRLGRFVFNK